MDYKQSTISLFWCEVWCTLGLPTVLASDLPEVMMPGNGRAVPLTLGYLIVNLLLFLFLQVTHKAFRHESSDKLH